MIVTMTYEELRARPWFGRLDHDLTELLVQSFKLLTTTEKWSEEFHDYSFIVFPAAKAYEGYLKKIFFELRLITEEDYLGRRFRIGRALNPELERELRKREGVYDKIVELGGVSTADTLWNAWRRCRNTIFHWFPEEKRAISREEAQMRVAEIVAAMDVAHKLLPRSG
jgi:hypothetical protein